jgi:tRNA (guanine26-N2/guanine27-N2)-dimethyltransferase
MSESEFETAFPSETVKEGKVEVLVPKLAAFKQQPSDYAPSKAPVFYNPVMELNRDIAILATQAYQRIVNREILVCEPLTSTGIRGVRFATEVRGAKNVLVSDINQRAFNLAKHNIQLNGLTERVAVKHKDANCLLSCNSAPRKRFDVIDVDPFGSPVPYLDSAIRALRNKGMLAVTATDMAPLCGVHAKAGTRKYGGKPLRSEYCQELAVRLMVGCVTTVAAKHDIGIRVLFSHCSDHYVRAYTEISYGAKKADDSIKQMGYVLHCFSCLHRETARDLFAKHLEQCPECGAKMDYAGPLWLGKLFDKQFCELIAKENMGRALRNSGKINRLLSLAAGEADAPATYYVVDKVSHKLGLPAPAVDALRGMLMDNSFQAVPTHFNTRGIRTDAPAFTIQRFLKELVTAK